VVFGVFSLNLRGCVKNSDTPHFDLRRAQARREHLRNNIQLHNSPSAMILTMLWVRRVVWQILKTWVGVLYPADRCRFLALNSAVWRSARIISWICNSSQKTRHQSFHRIYLTSQSSPKSESWTLLNAFHVPSNYAWLVQLEGHPPQRLTTQSLILQLQDSGNCVELRLWYIRKPVPQWDVEISSLGFSILFH
jgi:hypothetical protein